MILVTGGTGYIGSHTVVELLQSEADVLIVDNFSNSKPEVLARIHTITGKKPLFIKADIRDSDAMHNIFAEYPISAVLHFAGLKSISESVSKPLEYYDNNLQGSMVLLEAMTKAKVKQLVFSSSATVYGEAAVVPIDEDSPLRATNPYGRSKLMIEEILRDLAVSDAEWRIAILRYFNPVAAHGSGLLGEEPHGIPGNLMPYLLGVARGKYPELSVFGNDYPTHDGTGVRDYIHVVDLALGHLAALKTLGQQTGIVAVNLGTGQGYSVLDVLQSFEKANGVSLPYRIASRRAGDAAVSYANPSKALKLLDWRAERDLISMCIDAWRWQSANPDGYGI